MKWRPDPLWSIPLALAAAIASWIIALASLPAPCWVAVFGLDLAAVVVLVLTCPLWRSR